jgi:hypothetical protein
MIEDVESVESERKAALRFRFDITGTMARTVVAGTMVLWLLMVVLGIASVWGETWQSRFFEAATKVLLPLFNATIVACLSYVFGKPIATALALRFSRR